MLIVEGMKHKGFSKYPQAPPHPLKRESSQLCKGCEQFSTPAYYNRNNKKSKTPPLIPQESP